MTAKVPEAPLDWSAATPCSLVMPATTSLLGGSAQIMEYGSGRWMKWKWVFGLGTHGRSSQPQAKNVLQTDERKKKRHRMALLWTFQLKFSRTTPRLRQEMFTQNFK